MKAKIDDLETNSKIKNIKGMCRGIIDFKEGYQPGTKVVKVEKGDLATDSYGILARWINHFSQLLNVHGVNDVIQIEVHIAGPLMPEPSVFEFEAVIEKLKRHKLSGIDQIPAELIKTSGREIRS